MPHKTEGGLMDVIRCDEKSYLIWKWRPIANNNEATNKENAIRYGSSLRVKDGEVAVFVYKQKDGTVQDFIEGPFDKSINTANFPVLANIIGLTFGGGTPFQAEVYFINLAKIIQIKFGVPYFDVADHRFLDYAVPVAVRGTVTFKISDYREFIKLHRLVEFDLLQFEKQVRDTINKYVKVVVTNAPNDYEIPVLQLERKIEEINVLVENYITTRFKKEFGITVSSIDIGTIEIDKMSVGYKELKSVTQDMVTEITHARTNTTIQDMIDKQRIDRENMEESLRIQREETQREQKLKTEGENFAVHQLNQQTIVAHAAAESLGQMGQGGNISGEGMNPATMIAGMAIGGAVGQNIAGMIGNMINGVNTQAMAVQKSTIPQSFGTPPPIPNSNVYHVVVNGKAEGPFEISILHQMLSDGSLNANSFVWTHGMENWVHASQIMELAGLFKITPPPIPNEQGE